MGTFLSPFMAAIAQKQLGVLAVMVYQDGALIDEARIAQDVPHNLYSFTKASPSTAVGMAIDEVGCAWRTGCAICWASICPRILIRSSSGCSCGIC